VTAKTNIKQSNLALEVGFYLLLLTSPNMNHSTLPNKTGYYIVKINYEIQQQLHFNHEYLQAGYI